MHQGCHLWSRDQTNDDQYTPIFYDLYLLHYSPSVLSGVRVTRSLVLCVCFVGQCSSFCIIYFGHCAVCSSSIYGFWLPLWYLHSLLTSLSGFNLVSLVVISIDLLKDVVCMCLILSCSLYLQFFKRNRYFDFRHMFLLVLSSFWSLWSCGVPLSMLCATKSRMSASNRSGEMRSLAIIAMLYPV